MAVAASSQSPSPRRWRVADGKYPGLWARRLADRSIVYEIKIKQNDEQRSESLPKGTTERQAITEWKKLTAARDDGGAPLAKNKRLAEVASEALADLKAKGEAGLRSARSHSLYEYRWATYIKPMLGTKTIGKITAADVLRLIAKLRKHGRSEWTIHGIVTVLRFMLRHARHAGYMTNDPFATIAPDDLPRQEARETFDPRVLRSDEIEKLLVNVTESNRNAVVVAAYTGLRASEVCGLVWEDVSLLDGTVTVRAQLAKHSRGETPRRTSRLKSKASRREVPLVERAAEALRAQYERERKAGRGEDGDWVFATASGRPIDRHRLRTATINAATKARLGHVTPQVLRRSVATATAHAKLPVVVASALTGHSPQVYDKHYAKPFRDAEERAKVRESLASIGFGTATADQPLTNGA
jgi:integrase